MSQRFEYGTVSIKDVSVETVTAADGQTRVGVVRVDGRPARPSKRFWSSLHVRFGFTSNIFRYFRHDEVFARISQVAPNDKIRYCLEVGEAGDKLLAVTNPTAGMIRHDDLVALLDRYDAEDVSYSDGIVSSTHTPRVDTPFTIGGDDFRNKFVIDTPIDGFGRASVYLSLLRLICSNGAIGYSPAFRSELNVGRGANGVGTEYALLRVLDGFNNEEGYAAMRQRYESATKSWASVNEVNGLYRTVSRMVSGGAVKDAAATKTSGGAAGGDGAGLTRHGLLTSFTKMSGDLTSMYGLANLDALSVKRQRTLPTACKVYDLLNFASEVATHHATPDGGRTMQGFIGGLIGGEYDLEGTASQFTDWRDFFIGHDATTGTMAAMGQR